MRIYVTRRVEKVWNNDYIVDKHQRPHGWMLWGCFSSVAGKGPCLFWEKDWPKIGKVTYMEKIVPIIDGWMRLCTLEGKGKHILMQDNAPGHASAAT